MTIDEIRKDTDLLNAIEWDMTPEEAVTLYLEWGNNWAHGRVVKSKDDVSYYFVVNNWGEKVVVYLIRRNSEEAAELAEFFLPDDLALRFQESVGHHKGVYALEGAVKQWLKDLLEKPGQK